MGIIARAHALLCLVDYGTSQAYWIILTTTEPCNNRPQLVKPASKMETPTWPMQIPSLFLTTDGVVYRTVFFSFSFSGVEEPVHTIVIWSLACREARNQTKCFNSKYIRLGTRIFPWHCHRSGVSSSKRTSARQTDTTTLFGGKPFDRQNSPLSAAAARRPQHSRFSLLFPLWFLFLSFVLTARFGQPCWQGSIAFMACRGYTTTTEKKGGCTHSPRKKKERKQFKLLKR